MLHSQRQDTRSPTFGIVRPAEEFEMGSDYVEEYIAGIENTSNATRNAKDTCCGVISCNAKIVQGSSDSSESVESAKAD